jgi:hypothetical protein
MRNGENMGKKIQEMAVFIEFLASSGLAVFFHLALHNRDAALVIFGTGVLLSLATYLLRQDIERIGRKLMEKYEHAHEITFAIAQMTDPECQAKAQEIMAGAKRTLALLQNGYIPLDETEFYMKGAKYMDESQHHVKVVDPLTTGWDSRGSLINYYQANLRAIERGVKITRIFVINRDGLNDASVQKILLSQLRDGIEARVAFREELPATSDLTGRDTATSFDFAVYDGQVATEAFGQAGKYFGRMSREPQIVANYQQLFGLVEHVSHLLAERDDVAMLAAEVFSLAS